MRARRAALERLKARLDEIEPRRKAPGRAQGEAPAPLALLEGALHEVRLADWRWRPAALSFALALAGKSAAARGKAIVCLQVAHEARAEGALFGRGLSFYGVYPGRLLAVFARNEKELLWAAEEAARDRSVAAVLALAPAGGRLLGLTATRRLALAAEASKASPILIRTIAEAVPTAACVRWRIEAAPSVGDPGDPKSPGPPRWRVFLERFRPDGRLCGGAPLSVEWGHDVQDFRLVEAAPPLHAPLPAALADGPAQAPQRRFAGGHGPAGSL